MKPLFLSRADAHKILSGVPAMVARGPPSVAKSGESSLATLRHPPVPSAPSADATRVDLLEERTRRMEESNARMETMLRDFIQWSQSLPPVTPGVAVPLPGTSCPPVEEVVFDEDEDEDVDEYGDEDEEDEESESGFRSSLASPGTQSWKAPPLFPVMPDAFSFAPAVKEREPLVPEPSPELAAQGMACHGFDFSSWANFRYLEAQKTLQVSAPFQQLGVNPQLGSSGSSSDHLYSQMDQMLGTLSHGLLLQRKVLADAMQALISAHPSVGTDVNNLFASSGCAFQTTSDDLLRLREAVCRDRNLSQIVRAVAPHLWRHNSTLFSRPPGFFLTKPPLETCCAKILLSADLLPWDFAIDRLAPVTDQT